MNLGPIFRPARLTHDAARDDGGSDGGARDAHAKDDGSGGLGALPEWNLGDLYPAMDSPN